MLVRKISKTANTVFKACFEIFEKATGSDKNWPYECIFVKQLTRKRCGKCICRRKERPIDYGDENGWQKNA